MYLNGFFHGVVYGEEPDGVDEVVEKDLLNEVFLPWPVLCCAVLRIDITSGCKRQEKKRKGEKVVKKREGERNERNRPEKSSKKERKRERETRNKMQRKERQKENTMEKKREAPVLHLLFYCQVGEPLHIREQALEGRYIHRVLKTT